MLSQRVTSEPNRETAYTFPRNDVCNMVPSSALSILDIGCSNGSLGSCLRTLIPDRTITGVERDVSFIAEARSKLDEVICADLNEFDWSSAFGSRKFDCIIFADVLEHLLDPSRQLITTKNHLNSSGCIVVSLPNIRHHSVLSSIGLMGTFPRRERGIFDQTHLRWFTITDARTMLASAGLAVDAMFLVLRWGDIGSGLVNRLLNKLPQTVSQFVLLREFFTYQFCLRAVISR